MHGAAPSSARTSSSAAVGNLCDDVGDLWRRQRTVTPRVLLEELASGPLDGEEVHARRRLTDLDRADDVGMNDALAVACFAQEARDRRAIVAQLLAEDLHGHVAVAGMRCAKHGGCATFTHVALEHISRERTPYQSLPWHRANLIPPEIEGKRAWRCIMCSYRELRRSQRASGPPFS